MANHSTPMHLIRRLIQLRLQGYSKRSIARHLSLARKTVAKYMQQLESHFPDLSAVADWSEERVYVPLMEKAAFDSLDTLNQAINLHVQAHNRSLLQGRDYCREDRFLSIEKEALLPLPHRPYQFKQYLQVRVSRNSHVLLAEDRHPDPMSSHRQVLYSVPYQYVGKKVKLVVDAQTVEVYHHYSRIAIHKRQLLRYGYATCKEHLPAKHQYLMNWSQEYFKEQAQKIGPNTVTAFTHLLEKSSYKGQAYKSCAGILSLGKHYSRERIEAACRRAILFNALSYRHIKAILEKELDKIVESPLEEAVSILHENIRGAPAYQ